jgi:TM2 domain-containing membrane protein YozV
VTEPTDPSDQPPPPATNPAAHPPPASHPLPASAPPSPAYPPPFSASSPPSSAYPPPSSAYPPPSSAAGNYPVQPYQPQEYPPPPGYPAQGYPSYPAPGYPTTGYGPTVPVPVDPLTGQPLSPKTKMAAGLLQLVPAILFGFGGIGRLYAGNVALGVMQIAASIIGWISFACGFVLVFPFFVTAGVWVWMVVDGIVMLAGRPLDGQGRVLRS